MSHPVKQICNRCVLDTSIDALKLDEKGNCNFCNIHDQLNKEYPLNNKGRKILKKTLDKIKNKGRANKYDCIVGVSGGRDSTFVLHKAVKLGLRPLAVHFDNGWNSAIAVKNIKNQLEKLGVDLYTHVVDWEEFKDLQISFLKASTSDAEIPTDLGLVSTLYRVANMFRVKYVITGISFRTEGFSPISWTYMDGLYIKSVQKKFGKKKLKTYPNLTITKLFYYMFIKRIEIFPLLYYVSYDKEKVGQTLKKKYRWQYYGAHHHENIYTKFFQSYYLTTKFSIDKRILEHAAYIRSGQIKREEALKLKAEPYKYDQRLVNYTLSKLGLSKEGFKTIMNQKNKSFKDYSTYYPYIKSAKYVLIVAYKLKLIPKALYLRYVGP